MLASTNGQLLDARERRAPFQALDGRRSSLAGGSARRSGRLPRSGSPTLERAHEGHRIRLRGPRRADNLPFRRYALEAACWRCRTQDEFCDIHAAQASLQSEVCVDPISLGVTFCRRCPDRDGLAFRQKRGRTRDEDDDGDAQVARPSGFLNLLVRRHPPGVREQIDPPVDVVSDRSATRRIGRGPSGPYLDSSSRAS